MPYGTRGIIETARSVHVGGAEEAATYGKRRVRRVRSQKKKKMSAFRREIYGACKFQKRRVVVYTFFDHSKHARVHTIYDYVGVRVYIQRSRTQICIYIYRR